MPDMDGFETADLIRQRDRSRHTPIIFLTAYERTDVQMFQGYSLGAVDYLTKPFRPEVLRSKAAVFVELFQKTEQIKCQAELLRRSQEVEHERQLVEEKQRWEMERLREEAEREKLVSEELTRNVDERIRAEKELRAVKDELAVQLADMMRLHQLTVRLSKSLELPALLHEVLAAVTDLHGTDLGLFRLYDRERDSLTTAASIGFAPDDLEGVGQIPGGAEACGTAVARRASVLVEDIESDPLFAPCRAAANRAGYRAVLSTPLLTRSGDIVGTIAVYFRQPHCPSERVLRQVELYARQAAEVIDNARLYGAIQEANRRKDEFLAMLAHELRNPLAPLLNGLHIMRLKDSRDPAVEHMRDIAERQVRHLARMVDDLLDVSRITRGKIQLRKEPVRLEQVVHRTVECARPSIEERGHHLEVTLPPGPVCLEADPTRLEQILTNLLNNAAKYTEPGGRIALTAELDGHEVLLRVSDTGIGIDPATLPRVFDLFIQADRSLERSQGGLGIGLSLVRSLVELHGGCVSAHSHGLGKGSEFVVRLPLLPGAALPPEPERNGAKHSPGVGRPVRVLVVDDNQAAAQSLSMLLRLWGHEVELAYDGPAALKAAQAHQPDVILLDIGLPGLDGYQVARQLRSAEHGAGPAGGRDRLRPGRRPPASPGSRLRPAPGQAGQPGDAARAAQPTRALVP